jgi:hypothetical protein
MPYVGGMLIRTLALLALAACATTVESTSEANQAGEAVCDVRKYACDPLDLRGYRYRAPWGLPAWDTFCVDGPIAIE